MNISVNMNKPEPSRQTSEKEVKTSGWFTVSGDLDDFIFYDPTHTVDTSVSER